MQIMRIAIGMEPMTSYGSESQMDQSQETPPGGGLERGPELPVSSEAHLGESTTNTCGAKSYAQYTVSVMSPSERVREHGGKSPEYMDFCKTGCLGCL